MATIKSVGVGSNNGSSATVSATSAETTATTVGDVVLVVHGNDFYTEASMATPTATGSPTLTQKLSADTTTNNVHLRVWWYVANTAGAQTVSVTEGTGGEEKALAVIVLSGADSTNPFDGTASSAQATSASWTTPSVTPTGSTDLVFSIVSASINFHSTSATAPSGFTTDINALPDSAYRMLVGHKTLSSSGATGTFTWAATFSEQFSAATLAIKDAAGGSSVTGDAAQSVTAALTAAGSLGAKSSASQTATATLAAAGSGGYVAGASLSATATLTAAGVVGHSSGAALAATATLTASSGVVSGASLAETATLTATGVAGYVTGAANSATASLTAAGVAGYTTGAALSATATQTAGGVRGAASGASLAVTATLTADGTVTAAGSGNATLAVTATLAAAGVVGHSTGAALTVTATLQAAGGAGYSSGASLAVVFSGSAAPGGGVEALFLYTPPTYEVRHRLGRGLFYDITTSVCVWRKDGVWHQQSVGPPQSDAADRVGVMPLLFTRPEAVPKSVADELTTYGLTPADPSWAAGSLTPITG